MVIKLKYCTDQQSLEGSKFPTKISFVTEPEVSLFDNPQNIKGKLNPYFHIPLQRLM